MTSFEIHPERPEHAALIDPLLDRTFGTDRLSKTVYRLRAGQTPLPGLAFAAVGPAGTLLASLRFWAVRIEATPAILFGPLAVEPQLQGRGIGRALVAHGLAEAARLEHSLCVIVGDPPYYRPFGFVNAPERGLALPGPVDPARFQVLELVPGALEGVSGMVGRTSEADAEPRRCLRRRSAA